MPQTDILVRDGAIAAIGPRLGESASEEIDGGGMFALPGFVDTHWHLWGTLFRGIVDDQPETSWFPLKARLGPHVRPEDQEAGVRLSLVEAITAGITTVNDWAHNLNSPADADAHLRAHLPFPVRARLSYGTPSTHPGLDPEKAGRVMRDVGKPTDEPMDMDELARVEGEWRAIGGGDLLTFGVALRGPARSSPDVYRAEFAEARRRRLPISMHCAGTPEEVARIRQVEILAEDGLLGPDLILAHCNHISARERELIARSATHVSISPLNEVRYARSPGQLSDLLDAGVTVSFSLDSTAVVPTDPFEQLRTTYGHERVRTGRIVPPRRLLELATIEGARGLGLADQIGSLTVGKRADLLLLRADAANLAPGGGDAAELLIHGAHSSDVDTVVIDGRVVKRHGELVDCDVAAVVAGAQAAQARVLARARGVGWVSAKIVATVAR